MAEKLTLEMFMLTCPERQRTRHATLASLGSSDWRSDFSLVVDPDQTQPTGPARLMANFRRAFVAAGQSRAHCVLVVEDDINFNEHLEHNVRKWLPLVAPDKLGSLYRTSLSLKIGCQALIMRTAVAKQVAKLATSTSDASLWPADCWLRERFQVHYHSPSLVQHRDERSTWGAVARHRAENFDPTWRAS